MVDRLVVRDGIRVRLTDSIETALKWGGNRVVVLRKTENKSERPTSNIQRRIENWAECRYSTDYGNAETGFNLGELTPRHFSFNSHLGACPACHGLGTQLVVDPELMISDQTKTLAEGAITPWRRGTKRMRVYYRHLQDALIKHFNVNEDCRSPICLKHSKPRFTSARMASRLKWRWRQRRKENHKTVRRTRAANAAAL